MPGHIKKTSGPDPDPSPWLEVSAELKLKNKAKPYDPKKSVWVPNKAEGGYLEGLIESKDGAKVSVNVDGEVKVYKEDQVCQDDLGDDPPVPLNFRPVGRLWVTELQQLLD